MFIDVLSASLNKTFPFFMPCEEICCLIVDKVLLLSFVRLMDSKLEERDVAPW